MTARKKFAFSLLATCVVILVLEGFLRVLCLLVPAVDYVLASPRRPQERQWDAFKPRLREFKPLRDEQLGYRPNPRHPEHDANGFRNRAVPRHAAVVALGDSHTYGTGIARERAWPQQLEAISGAAAYNLAYEGYGPCQSLLLLKQGLLLHPKVVVAALYSGNDFIDCYRMVYERKQLPQLKSDNADLARQIREAEIHDPIARRLRSLHPIYAGGFPAPPFDPYEHMSPVREFLTKHSKLYALAYALCHLQQLRSGRDALSWLQLKHIAAASEDRWEVAETAGFRTIVIPRYRSPRLDLSDPRIREGHHIALRAIRQMADRARDANAQFLVLLVPTKEIVCEGLVENPSTYYLKLVQKEKEAWTATTTALREGGIDFVDALPALRKCVAEDRQAYPIHSDGHLNGVGHRVLAEAVLKALRERGWLPD